MLPRKNRIPTEKFPEVTRGKMVQNDLFRVVIKSDTTLSSPKCAVVVPNKLAKTAVVRNRIRRQVYASLGEIITSLPVAYLSIFPKTKLFETAEATKSLRTLLCSKK